MDNPTAATDWLIFKGDCAPHDGLKWLPEAPRWRPFGQGAVLVPPSESDSEGEEDIAAMLGRKFRCSKEMREAVNLAVYLRRPLLVTGKPGCGKSSLVLAVARELRLGPVLRWPITSKSEIKEGLYLYDALGRLEEPRRTGQPADDTDIGRFIELGPLGTALLPTDWPRALLIDEIDKSDLDFPNNLLNIFEDGEYTIPELARALLKDPERGVSVRTWRGQGEANVRRGHVRCRHFPFVVMTSNQEREFPAAFLRRCIRITIEEPKVDMLGDIVESHFDEATKTAAKGLIAQFFENRSRKELATDQLLNAVYLILASNAHFDDNDKKRVLEKLYQPISGADATR